MLRYIRKVLGLARRLFAWFRRSRSPASAAAPAFIPSAADWLAVGASVAGSRHGKEGKKCEDAFKISGVGACVVAAVADGVSSASRAREGAVIAVGALCGQGEEILKRCSQEGCQNAVVSEEDIAGAFLRSAAAVAAEAERFGFGTEVYAATAAMVIVAPSFLAVGLIGDCAVVARFDGDSAYSVPVWPEQGRYVGETRSLVDPHLRNHLKVKIERRPPSEVSLFTDGLLRSALDMSGRRARQPSVISHYFKEFAEEIEKFAGSVSVPADATETQRRLAAELSKSLADKSFDEATDDDRTLVLVAGVGSAKLPAQ